MKKKETAPAQGGMQNTHAQFSKFTTARQYRVVQALSRGPHSREQIDHISGSSNGPEVVRQLRGLGWDIPCKLVPHTDRDGLHGKHGVYCLSQPDRLKWAGWLSRQEVAHV